ncbi:MAG: DUF167 domain-containing protein [Rhizobiales bacterium]|nr:DUF167 domain-containing protein [Hyphomicrobiales bacterium]
MSLHGDISPEVLPRAAIRKIAGGITIRVRLTPRASSEAIEGFTDIGSGRDALIVKVTAPPVDAAPNRALEKVMARALGVPRTSASVVSGHRNRVKSVAIHGDASALAHAASTAFGRSCKDD